jgi:predicted CoA-binding protein
MNTRISITNFLNQRSYAVVGVSRSGKKFGNNVYKMLRERGSTVYAVNPLAATIEGDRCYATLKDLPGLVDGVVVVVPPKQTESVVREAAAEGIQRIWLQQGSESRKAIQYCEQYGLDVIHGQCILMFAEPVTSVHKFHQWVMKVIGKLPM